MPKQTADTFQLSIIIPAKNEESNIERCIESIKNNLADANFEIIVVDNGSADNTARIAKAKGAIVYVLPELPVAALRNFGAQNAHYNILAFIDADCLLTQEWLPSAMRHFDCTDVACVGSTPAAEGNGTWVERSWSQFRTRRKKIVQVAWLNSSNFIVRQAVFMEFGGFSEQLATCEDVDICYRIRKRYTIIYDPSVRVIHLGEPKTMAAFFKKEVWRGKNNYTGLRTHGISVSELKSLLLPVYFLLSFVLIFAGVLAVNIYCLLLSVSLFLFPLFLFFAWMLFQSFNLFSSLQMTFLFFIYSLGRCLAVVNLLCATSFAEGKK